MKTFNVLASVIVSCLLLFGCSKSSDSSNTQSTAPTASFSWQSSNLTAPSTVVFTNTSTNATSYSWDFGDGNTSTVSSPTHIYQTSGTYVAKLTATNSSSSANSSATITISTVTPTSLQINVGVQGVSVLLFTSSSDLNTYYSGGANNSVAGVVTNSNGIASFTNVTAGVTYYWLATSGCLSSYFNSADFTTIVANTTNTGSVTLQSLETLSIKNTNIAYPAQITINGTYFESLPAGQTLSIKFPFGTYNISSYDPNDGVTQTATITLSTCGGTYNVTTNP